MKDIIHSAEQLIKHVEILETYPFQTDLNSYSALNYTDTRYETKI